MEFKKGIVSGVVAGLTLIVIDIVAMGVPGMNEWYTNMFPEMMAGGMWAWALSVLSMGIFMGLVYSVINTAVPGQGGRKGVNYGVMVWLLAGLMWPIMMLGFAPLSLAVVEIILGLISYSITGIVLVFVFEKI